MDPHHAIGPEWPPQLTADDEQRILDRYTFKLDVELEAAQRLLVTAENRHSYLHAARLRRRLIVAAARAGWSRRQIGEVLGISGNRVTQIINKASRNG